MQSTIKTHFKTVFLLFIMIVWGCGQKSHEHEGHEHDQYASDPVESEGNQALYDKVMKVHDEVMPKMDDLYRMKEELKKKLADTPAIAEEKKKEIEATIAQLDSASEGMMVWMRQFNPLPDSLGEEKAREYLENEMERVNKVKEDILQSIEKAKQSN